MQQANPSAGIGAPSASGAKAGKKSPRMGKKKARELDERWNAFVASVPVVNRADLQRIEALHDGNGNIAQLRRLSFAVAANSGRELVELANERGSPEAIVEMLVSLDKYLHILRGSISMFECTLARLMTSLSERPDCDELISQATSEFDAWIEECAHG